MYCFIESHNADVENVFIYLFRTAASTLNCFFYKSRFWRDCMSTYCVFVISLNSLLCIDSLWWDVVSEQGWRDCGVTVRCTKRGIMNRPVLVFTLKYTFVFSVSSCSLITVFTSHISPVQQCVFFLSTRQQNEGKPPLWKINHKLLGWMYN